MYQINTYEANLLIIIHWVSLFFAFSNNFKNLKIKIQNMSLFQQCIKSKILHNSFTKSVFQIKVIYYVVVNHPSYTKKEPRTDLTPCALLLKTIKIIKILGWPFSLLYFFVVGSKNECSGKNFSPQQQIFLFFLSFFETVINGRCIKQTYR